MYMSYVYDIYICHIRVRLNTGDAAGWFLKSEVVFSVTQQEDGTRQVEKTQIMIFDRQIFQQCFGLVSYRLQS